MKKLSFKKVFSRAFVVSLAAIAVSGMNVDAMTINETAGKEIEEGSYILGISRFTPGTVLTAVRVSKATTNDNNFNKDVEGYEGANIYYYDLGEWYVLNDDNKAVPVSDAKVIKTLDARDIYYVDNVEKTTTITYKRDLPKGKKLYFETDKKNKNVKYDAEKGTLSIPVTAKSVAVYSINENKNNNDDRTGTLLDRYTKEYTDDENENFEYTSSQASVGKIVADDKKTMSKDVKITNNGNTISVGGTIKWAAAENDSDKAGHKIGLVLTAPNGCSTKASANVEVTRGDGKKENFVWTDVTAAYKYVTNVKENEVITLKLTWPTLNTTQTFTIRVTGTLEEMPAGKISGKTEYVFDSKTNKYTTEERLTSSVSSDQSAITFSGKDIDWNGKVTVYIEPNEYFTTQSNFKYSDVVVKYTNLVKNTNYNADDEFTTEKEYKDSGSTTLGTRTEMVDGKKVIAVDVPLSEDNVDKKGRTATLAIDWKNGYVQNVDVVLNNNTPFLYPEVVFTGNTTYNGSDVTFKTEEETPNNIEVKGFVKWDITNGGTTIEATIAPSKAATGKTGYAADDFKYLSLVVDNKEVTHTINKGTDNEKEELLTFDKTGDGMSSNVYTLHLNVNREEQADHTIQIKYGDAVVKTYTLHISADSDEKKEGTLTIPAADNAKYSLNREDKDTYNITGTYHGEERDHTTGKVTKPAYYEALPFMSKFGKNGITLHIENSAYSTSSSIKVSAVVGNGNTVENTYTLTAGATDIDVPLVDGSTTAVTVEWDSVNKQTFNVYPKGDKVTYANADEGSIALAGATTPDAKDPKTLAYNGGTINWNGALKDTTIPVKLTAPSDVTTLGNDITVSVSGGKLQNTDEKGENYFKYSLGDMATADADKQYLSTSDTTITANIPVSERQETLKITVQWTKEYAVTYTINVIDATLNKGYAGIVTVGTASNNANNIVEVPEMQATYTNGEYRLTVNLKKKGATDTNAIPDDATIKVTDARPAKSYSQKNGAVEETISPRTAALSASTGNFYICVDKDTKSIPVVVTWENGYVEEFTIDVSNVILPEIVFTDKVQKDEKTGDYSMTVKVGDQINLISKATNVDLDEFSVVQNSAYAEDKNKVVEVYNADTNTYRAVAAGKAVYTVGSNAADTKTVTVYVVDNDKDEKVVISNPHIEFSETEGAKISVTPVGGRDGYTVSVVVEEEKNGIYTEVLSSTSLTKEYNSDVYSYTTKALDSSKHYRYTITAVSSNNLVGEYGKAELVIDDAPVTYTVSLDSNGGSNVSDLVVGSGETIEEPKVTKNSTAKYYYVLKGWYEVNSDNFDENGNYKDDDHSIDSNGDIVITPAQASALLGTIFDSTNGVFKKSADSYTFGSVEENITLKAVWYRFEIEE